MWQFSDFSVFAFSEDESKKRRKKKKKQVEDDSLETTYEKSGKQKTVQVSYWVPNSLACRMQKRKWKLLAVGK